MEATCALTCYVYSKFFFISQSIAAQLSSIGLKSEAAELSQLYEISVEQRANAIFLIDCTCVDAGQINRDGFLNGLALNRSVGLIMPKDRLVCRELVAKGFIAVGLANWPIERIANLVNSAAMGHGTIPSEILLNLRAPLSQELHPRAAQNWTPKQLAIIRLIALGAGNKAIGLELDLSEAHIKMCVHQITKKIGAKNRASLVVAAIRLGLISEMEVN